MRSIRTWRTAACVENEVTWSYPPCGGMVCDEHASLEARCRFNGCTEPIMTRRLKIVAEDCIALFDALQGDREQRFSSLFQIKGFRGLEGDARETGHTRRFTDDPLSDGQFITDCRPFDAHTLRARVAPRGAALTRRASATRCGTGATPGGTGTPAPSADNDAACGAPSGGRTGDVPLCGSGSAWKTAILR